MFTATGICEMPSGHSAPLMVRIITTNLLVNTNDLFVLGINPELNNLTLSVTTLDAGDIVMVASDGLTDNYDPTVCKFTVNLASTDQPRQQKSSHASNKGS